MSARRLEMANAPIAMVIVAAASLVPAQEPASHGALPSPERIARLAPDGGPNYNRLVFEKSPYLLQHAANPVDWHPWGEEAFEKARREDKPIFLSIGYSTCHWCHVMERESFSNDEVAALMNEHYVAIKVDREERPDIDQHYMTASIATRGSGGWPLTVFMTPEKKPFYIGTYFPLNSRPDRPGMLELLPSLAEAWKNQRQAMEQTAERIVELIRENAGDSPGGKIGAETLELAYRQIASRYDFEHGGIGAQQKFPYPSNLTFLLRYWRRTGEPRALEMVEQTLTEMRRGGIFDHVGFGFHRYATDRQWLVPHFEKMLYDQAMIAIAYVETYRATGKEEYADTARAIFAYLLRDMTSPEGAFFSAEDADSEGAEGKFYVWSMEEAREALGDEDADFFFKVFNFEREGNFVEQFTGHRPGTNIPHLRASREEIASELGMSEADLARRIESCRERLFAVRERRVHPLKDDKVLTDWNGLMIAALAMGGRALDEPRYSEAAARAADFLWENLREEKGRLKKRYRSGEAAHEGRLADYAFFTWGLLELYEATFDVVALERALELNRIALDLFWDSEAGGFFMSALGGEQLPVRTKETRDMAYPSGNSVAAMNLARLGRMTADAELERKARALLAAFSAGLAREPAGHAQMLAALDFSLGPANEIVIVGVPGAADTRAMARALGRIYAPNKVVLFRPSDDPAPAITRLAEFTLLQRSIEGRATAYVCTDYACRAPTTDPAEMLAQLAASAR